MKTQRGSQFIPMVACILLVASGATPTPADTPTVLWSQTYAGSGLADGRGLAVDDNAVYVTGRTWASGNPDDLFLNKYDLAGNPVWSQTWGVAGRSDQGFNVARWGDQVHVAGNTRRYTYDNEPDAITLKYDTNGTLDYSNSPDGWWTLWTSDGYNGFDYAKDVALDAAGNLYVLGTEEYGYINTWTYLEKYNPAGVKQWHRHYGVDGSPRYCGSEKLVLSGDNLYAAGTYNAAGVDAKVQVLKYSTDGTLITAYHSVVNQGGLDVAVSEDDIYVSGVIYDGDPTRDVLVLKLHDDGSSISFIGSTTFAGPGGEDFGWAIDVANGTVYVVGSTTDGSDTDALLLAYDSDLNLLWSYSWGGTGNDSANDLVVRDGVLYVAGTLGNEAFVDAYAVIGDLNCDGVVNFADINPFVLALSNPAAYEQTFPECRMLNADINGDQSVNFGDINPFVALLTGR